MSFDVKWICFKSSDRREVSELHRGCILTQLRHDDAVQGPGDRIYAAQHSMAHSQKGVPDCDGRRSGPSCKHTT